MESLRGAGAITGFAELPASKEKGLRASDLAAQVAVQATRDAGLDKRDIDGLLCAAAFGEYGILWPSYLCEYLQLAPKYFDSVELGGASAAGMLLRAAAVINAGICQQVLCVTADAVDTAAFNRIAQLTPTSDQLFEFPYGNVAANPGYALIAHRHMHEFGTTPEQLAKVVVEQRHNASTNPAALYYGQALSLEEVLNAKMILDPLHRPEIVTPCNYANAFVVSAPDRASDSPHTPVYLLGVGEAGSHLAITRAPSLTDSWIQHSARRAWDMSGCTPQDMDFIQPYDCYSITVIITLEDLGFCKKGEGGAFVESMDFSPTGSLPCNTYGGQLGYGQAGLAGGMTHVIEGIRQLMGRADGRQVANAECGLVHGNGGIMGEQVTVILGTSL